MSDAEVKDLNQISKKDIYYTPSGKYIQFIHDHSEKHLMRGNSYRTEVIGCSRARALLLRHLMNLKKKFYVKTNINRYSLLILNKRFCIPTINIRWGHGRHNVICSYNTL